MKVGDLVEYTGKARIGIKRGAIGCVEGNQLIEDSFDVLMVKILTTGIVRRFLERDLKVVQ